MKTILIANCVAVLAITAASAETRSSTEYFVVLDTKTKTCAVADKKPKTKLEGRRRRNVQNSSGSRERNENHQSLHRRMIGVFATA